LLQLPQKQKKLGYVLKVEKHTCLTVFFLDWERGVYESKLSWRVSYHCL